MVLQRFTKKHLRKGLVCDLVHRKNQFLKNCSHSILRYRDENGFIHIVLIDLLIDLIGCVG